MSKIFCACVEPPETDMSSLPHQVEVSGWLGLESLLAAGREEVKTQVETWIQKCKDRRKLRAPFWGEFRKEATHQTRIYEDETSEQSC